MINKKLLSFDRGALRYVGANVAFQWLGMLCNVIFVRAIAQLVGAAFAGSLTSAQLWQNLVLCLATVPMRFAFTMLASAMSDQASKDVKRTLRSSIYAKLARLGPNYTETAATSEVVMLASEGVEQIDTYFAKYLPQLFYSLLAPVTLFVLLVGVHARSAIILLCCVPLIPMSIVAVQKFAKKLLANYWGEYTTLGDSFLENIQGLTTLKIYQADGWKHEQMNAQAERFRRITMKVLTMQLNSVTLMDLMAYGGAGFGIISAVAAFAAGRLTLTATLTIVLLAAVGFLPETLNTTANAVVSFVCAMQVQTFRKVRGHAYASTMCIGNMRSGTEALCAYCHTGDKEILHKALTYFGVVLLFALGAGVGSIATLHWGAGTIWLSCGLLTVSFLIMFIHDEEQKLNE